MKSVAFHIWLLLLFCLSCQLIFAQANFQSNATGTWENPASWTIISGTDADGIPDANDNVTILAAHTITLGANEFIQNITLNGTTGTRLALGSFTLDANGTLSGPPPGWSNAIITCGTGRFKFSGNSRALFGSNWDATTPTNWRVEVALNAGQTGTASTNVKAGDWIITSGTFIVGALFNYHELRIDDGSNGTGTLSIASGAYLITDRCGERTGTGSTYCGTINVNGILEVHGLYLSGSPININNGGKLIVAKSTPTISLVSNPTTGTFTYAIGSTLEYNEDLSSIARMNTGPELFKNATSFHPFNVVCNNDVGINLKNNITVQPNGTFFITRGNITTTNASTIAYSSNDTLTYNGSIAQSAAVTATLEWPTVNPPANLTISNSSDVTLQNPRSINGTLTLVNGRFMTSASHLFTMNAGSSVSSVSNASFVYGPMAKTGTTNFTFPIGKDNEYRPVTIESLSGSETFTAEYFHQDPDPTYDENSLDFTLDHVSTCEYWTLTRAGTQNAKVRLSWDTYSCGVTATSELSIAQWNGSTWKDKGNGGTTGAISPATGTVVTSSLITSFFSPGPFTLASTTGNNPLPVNLLFFDAKSNGETVDVNWATAAEINSDYFSVERSSNAVDFFEMQKIAGAGTSSQMHEYRIEDLHPFQGISYYRLKQVDDNGKITCYAPVAVSRNSFNGIGIIAVSPVPFEENPTLSFQTQIPGKLELTLHDPLGRIVFTMEENSSKDNSRIVLPISKSLSSGIYFLEIKYNDAVKTLKILKK